MRALVHYALAAGLLSLYGTEVCPFVERLGWPSVVAMMIVAFGLAALVRAPLQRRWVDGAVPLRRSGRQLFVDLGLFLGVGLGLTLYNTAANAFPVGSGLKVLLGCATIGLFAGLDLALARERRVARSLQGHAPGSLSPADVYPLPRKFSVITVAALVFVAGALALLVVKDFQWLLENPGVDPGVARSAVLLEIAFVGGVILAYGVHLVLSYTGNLSMFFSQETAVLAAVARGDLDQRVPITSRDEFGQIAAHTNTMIAGLRERRRFADLIGKVVSPEVARRLLADGGACLGGERRRLVILMSDVRGFTSRSEAADPEALVSDLNRYFSQMVAIVHAHGGVVDKFLGDGMLAIFGLSGGAAAEEATAAARAMVAALPALNARLSAPIRIGVGVHCGEVVAGAIGAPDRLEFTVIGDAVNIAARLEGLTKSLPGSLAISAEVFAALSPAAQAAWSDLGSHALKGRARPIHVYGEARASP